MVPYTIVRSGRWLSKRAWFWEVFNLPGDCGVTTSGFARTRARAVLDAAPAVARAS